ncbi:hypothetical protein F3Y22_tig00117048pilonHSYRG00188 [Hibiscus syriacus]|uniref:Myosin motor domain-containing protein n=1 Tax=Hibiscus syriacus TaxID=106335 RepID=A0A6A2WBW1_HIBSY|nr:hypothetical protein F3Y22_tig00117048pilonHSYRG00188 [Hibiscus syriacus]
MKITDALRKRIAPYYDTGWRVDHYQLGNIGDANVKAKNGKELMTDSETGLVQKTIDACFYQHCLNLQPNHSQALTNMGNIYMEWNMVAAEATLAVTTFCPGQFFELMRQLENTTPHFIRCIKPNCKQVPDMYEEDVVLHQLRYCGVLEVVRISKSGYPTRMTHQKFAERTGRKFSEAKVFPTVDMETPYEHQIQVVPSIMAELQRRVLKAETNLAYAYKDSGDVEIIVKRYKQALFFRPNFPEATCNLLHILQCVRNWEERDKMFTEVEGIIRRHITMHNALADLCLDKPLCNTYTTGTNVLWAGLPMVTLSLKKMATRFVGSLCPSTSLGEDMIVHSMKDYEERVVEFALNRPRLQSLTSKLKEVRMTWSLFDTARWVQNLERAYFTTIIEGMIGYVHLPTIILKPKENMNQMLKAWGVKAQSKMGIYRNLKVGGRVYLKIQSYHQTSLALRKGLKLAARFYGSIILDKRREQEHNQMQWMKLGLENVTVVNYIVLPSPFLDFDPWGQGSFRKEGIVTIKGEAIRIGARELGKSEKGL